MFKSKRKWLMMIFMLVAILSLPLTAQAKVRINKKKATIGIDRTVQLKVKGTKKKVKWRSYNRNIASVNKKGLVYGEHAGKTTIEAKVGGKKYKCRVTVKSLYTASSSTSTTSSSGGTVAQQNAIKKAKEYLNVMSFSRLGLVHQLEYEKFSNADALWAVDHLNVNWSVQAAKKAKEYLNTMAFSRTGLIKQLEYEKFTNAEAVYGADNAGADWYAQAIKKAREYLNVMSFSHDGLVKQLVYEGFSSDQAEYGVNATGL